MPGTRKLADYLSASENMVIGEEPTATGLLNLKTLVCSYTQR